MLSEFRSRLMEGGVEALLLVRLLESCRSQGLVKERGNIEPCPDRDLELVLMTLLHTLEWPYSLFS